MNPRVGSVVYATSQGLGYLARDFYTEDIFQEVLVFQHTIRQNHYGWYTKDQHPKVVTTRPFMRAHKNLCQSFLDSVDVILFFESPFDWSFMEECKKQGKKTVLMMMYEWTPLNLPVIPDLIICPSKLDEDYAKQAGHKHVTIPVPVPRQIEALYNPRKIASRFLYAGGNMGCRHDSRGAKLMLEAFDFVDPKIEFTYRVQDESAFNAIGYTRRDVQIRWPNVQFEIGVDTPYLEQWIGYDVRVAPEKYNGLSLPLQESKAAGMYCLTTDRYPTNQWIGFSRRIKPSMIERGSVGSTYNSIDICQIDPKELAYSINELAGQDIYTETSASADWLRQMSWDVLKPVYKKVIQELFK